MDGIDNGKKAIFPSRLKLGMHSNYVLTGFYQSRITAEITCVISHVVLQQVGLVCIYYRSPFLIEERQFRFYRSSVSRKNVP